MEGGHVIVGNVLVKVSTTMDHTAEAQGLARHRQVSAAKG